MWNDAPEGVRPGKEGLREFFALAFAALPDWHATIEDVIAADDKVVHRYTASGTHTGDFMGSPPARNKVSVQAMTIYRFEGGKAAKWMIADWASFTRRLGVIP